MIIKSGTNQFHGTGVRLPWPTMSSTPLTPPRTPGTRIRRNDYGFNVGGPVWIPKLYNGKDKTFFFFNWESVSRFHSSQSHHHLSYGSDPGLPQRGLQQFDRASQVTPETCTSVRQRARLSGSFRKHDRAGHDLRPKIDPATYRAMPPLRRTARPGNSLTRPQPVSTQHGSRRAI